MTPKKEIEKLRAELERHNRLYYLEAAAEISDFEFEFQMALMNRKLEPTIETVFLTPREEYTYLSSRIVKEIARLGGNVEAFVPISVAKALAERFGRVAPVAPNRFFLPEEDRVAGERPVVVLSDTLWRTRFGADPKAVGRQITLDGDPVGFAV